MENETENNTEELSEGMIKYRREDAFTIDPFVNNVQYNESIQTLQNNGIKYLEWVSIITPFNFFFTLENGQKPIMVDSEEATLTVWKNVVSKTQPLAPTDIYTLYRRGSKGANIQDYILNDAFGRAHKSKKVVIFYYKNKEQLLELSKSYGRIYALGKYLNGRYRIGMCFDSRIKNVIAPSDVLLEKSGKHSGVGTLEADINYNVLRNREKIIKYIQTPYFDNGKFRQTVPISPIKI